MTAKIAEKDARTSQVDHRAAKNGNVVYCHLTGGGHEKFCSSKLCLTRLLDNRSLLIAVRNKLTTLSFAVILHSFLHKLQTLLVTSTREVTINHKLMSFLEKECLLFNFQFGFSNALLAKSYLNQVDIKKFLF